MAASHTRAALAAASLGVFLSILGAACAAEDEVDPCGVEGVWDVDYTVGAGSCTDPGGRETDTYTFTLVGDTFVLQDEDGDQPDVGSFDPNGCSMVLQHSENAPETETTYEIRSSSVETIRFEDGAFASTVSLDADLYEAGTMVGSCSQAVSGTGTLR